MNIWIIISILAVIISILALLYFSSYSKLKEYKEKMDTTENIIDENLNKKLDIIISLNGRIKSVTNKKDYLKDYVELRNYIMTNIEKDIKLDEGEKLINDLKNDFLELNKDVEFNNSVNELRQIDEILTGAKNVFNQTAIKSNSLIKTFPSSIVSKISKFKIRSFYNNKTDELDNF